MYCVKCGVKLQDGMDSCPLCGTSLIPYLDSHETPPIRKYSERFPEEDRHGLFFTLGLATALLIVACLICLIICMKTYRSISWSGYVLFGSALIWILLILPFWFKKRSPFVFVPVDFAAVSGYLLYICLYNHQTWFLSFALPVTLLTAFLSISAYVLFRYLKKGRLFILGGLLIALGGSCMLTEYFEHITFGTEMFLWSPYCVGLFSSLGLFLIAAGIIRPLARYLERKFFA